MTQESSPRGWFITLEGIDGTGKTTLANSLVASLEALGQDVLYTKAPGELRDGKLVGSSVGPGIRELLFFNPTTKAMATGVSDMLFLADHIQLTETVIRPAVGRGQIVLCDRYFDSQDAYAPERNTPAWVQDAYNQNKSLVPDMTVLMVCAPEVSLDRARSRQGLNHQNGKAWNQIEAQRRVQTRFIENLRYQQRTFIIDVTHLYPAEVAEKVMAEIVRRRGLNDVRPPTTAIDTMEIHA